MGYVPGDIQSTSNGLQIASNSNVLYVSPSGFHQVETPADAGDLTYTPAQILGGFILQGTTAGATAATLPTAADMVAAMNGTAVGSSVRFIVRNIKGGATITMTASDITINGEPAIVTSFSGEYMIVFSDVSTGNEAAICYVINSAADSETP